MNAAALIQLSLLLLKTGRQLYEAVDLKDETITPEIRAQLLEEANNADIIFKDLLEKMEAQEQTSQE